MAEQESSAPGPDSLWKLYAFIRANHRKGVGMETLNDFVRKATADDEKKLGGVRMLLDELGIEANLGEDILPKDVSQGRAVSAAQGLTLGFADELAGLAAGAGALVPGGRSPREAYSETRDAMRGTQEYYESERPMESLGMEAAGAAVPAFFSGGLTGLAKGGGLVRRAVATGGRMGALGAAEGAAYGVGTAEGGLAERAKGGAIGGAVGGAAGGIMGVATPVLAQVAGKTVGRLPGIRGLLEQRGAAGAMAGIASDAGIPPQQLASGIKAAPAGTKLADLDPMLARYANVARRGSPALERTGGPVEAIMTREGRKGERIIEATRNMSKVKYAGEPDDVAKAAKKAWRKRFLRPLQEQSGEFGSPRVRKVMKAHPEIETYLPNAQKVRETQKLTLGEAWDALQEMQHRIGSNIPSNQKESLIRAASAWDDMLRQDVPGFGEAMQKYAQIMARFDAYDLGKKSLNRSRRQIAKQFRDLGPSEEIAYRQGMLDQVETKIQNAEGKGALVNRLLEPGSNMRQKLRSLFSTDEAFSRWTKRMDVEGRWARTAKALRGEGAAGQIGEQQGLGAVITRAPSLLNELLTIMVEDPVMQGRVAEKVGRILLEAGPEAAADALMQAGRVGGRRGAATAGVSGLLGKTAAEQGRPQGLLDDERR